jgi:hypothetical protein
VTLEITETAPMREPREVVPLLERLKDIGVGLSIDDFGTGYSSLSLLRQLPVDEIKIDQQFVRGLLESKQSLDIVRTTLALAGNFGLRTVAEGIEDQATLVALRDMGCEFGQGFGIARPADLRSARAAEMGGLSGAPLRPLARRALQRVAEAAEGRLALIAAGGIDSGAEALVRIRMGAGAVQLYSALVHHGPGLVRAILSDLADRLRAEGFTTISEAVGTLR